MSTNGQNNRRSFRVSERVYLKYEVISDREFHEGLDHRKLRKGVSDGLRSTILDLEARFEEKLYVLRTESGRLAECMSILNEKLNAVIEQLPDLRQSKASLARSEPMTCDIGADGMAFPAEKNLEEGTKLAMRFLLESDNRYIETFARIVRIIDPPGDADASRPFGIAVEFEGMKAAQKEMLIQHLFNRESETLRMRRLELDSADLNG
jgi:hypothetical protein